MNEELHPSEIKDGAGRLEKGEDWSWRAFLRKVGARIKRGRQVKENHLGFSVFPPPAPKV